MVVGNDGKWSFYIRTTEIPTSGSSNISIYSIDKAKNRGRTITKSIRIDSSSPIPTVIDNSEGLIANGSSTFNIKFSSNVSGFTKSDVIEI
jgi:hypothetical protein